MKPFISVCTILKNEEFFLQEFIESYSELADEFILVDTGSNDRSIEIIESFGIKPFHYKWINDFGKARTHSLSLATGQWICVADADDRIRKEDAIKLKNLLANCQHHAVVLPYVNLNNFEWNGSEPNILSTQDRLIFFQNNLGIDYRGAIHENPMLSIEENNYTTCNYKIPIYHLGYAQELIQEKSERNAKIITDLYNSGIRDPHIVYHFCSLNWSSDPQIFSSLQEALKCSTQNRKYTILESLCHWIYDFDSNSKSKLSEFLDQLEQIKSSSKTLDLFKAREAFESNLIDQSLSLYNSLADFESSEISSRYKFEIRYRLTFLLAAKGLIDEAISYSKSFEEYLKVNEFFHLVVKLNASLGHREQVQVLFQNKPTNLSNLDPVKLAELKQIAHHFQISI
ncbi:MAG: glycosyltransferase [Candidatus Cloacimonetes bacterium]|nr:glycosyltransferase [Candidatus Cloacimonadota bacterium]